MCWDLQPSTPLPFGVAEHGPVKGSEKSRPAEACSSVLRAVAQPHLSAECGQRALTPQGVHFEYLTCTEGILMAATVVRFPPTPMRFPSSFLF